MVKALGTMGVDAYRGATQLNIVEPDNGDSHLKKLDDFVARYPHEAKYLIDHVIYLPVNKTVPFHELDRICRALSVVVASAGDNDLLPTRPKPNVNLRSKL